MQPEHITKLYRSYCAEQESHVILRHRGKSRRRAAFFFRNTEAGFQAAQLASLFMMYGLMSSNGVKLEPRHQVGHKLAGGDCAGAYHCAAPSDPC